MQNLLFSLPGRILCEQSPLIPEKMMSMLLTLLFTSLSFFGLGEIGLSMYGPYSLSRTLI
jgi:hypothetical protein